MKRRVLAMLMALTVTFTSLPQNALPVYAADVFSDGAEMSGDVEPSAVTAGETAPVSVEAPVSTNEQSGDENANVEDVFSDGNEEFTDPGTANPGTAEPETGASEATEPDVLTDGAVSPAEAEEAPSEAQGESVTPAAETSQLTLDQNALAVITEGSPEASFTFTAPEDGSYYFYSEDDGTNQDTYGYLYDSEGNLLEENDDAQEHQFGITKRMTQGETCTLKVRFYYESTYGQFEVGVNLKILPSSISFSEDFRKVYALGIDERLPTGMLMNITYENGETQQVYGGQNDSYGNYVNQVWTYNGAEEYMFRNAGEYTLTVSCEGVECSQTVTAMPLASYVNEEAAVTKLTEGTSVSRSGLRTGMSYDYVFTAGEDSVYSFSYQGDMADIWLYDMQGKRLDYSYRSDSHRLSIKGAAGQSYLMRVSLYYEGILEDTFTISAAKGKEITGLTTDRDTYTVVYRDGEKEIDYNIGVQLTYEDGSVEDVILLGDKERDSYGNSVILSRPEYGIGTYSYTVGCGSISKVITINYISRLSAENEEAQSYPEFAFSDAELLQGSVEKTFAMSEKHLYLKLKPESDGAYRLGVKTGEASILIYDKNDAYEGETTAYLTGGETYLAVVCPYEENPESVTLTASRLKDISEISLEAPERFYSAYKLFDELKSTVAYSDGTYETLNGIYDLTENGQNLKAVLVGPDGTEYKDADEFDQEKKYGAYTLRVSYGKVFAEASVSFVTREELSQPIAVNETYSFPIGQHDLVLTVEEAGLYDFSQEGGNIEIFTDTGERVSTYKPYLEAGTKLLISLYVDMDPGSLVVEKLPSIEVGREYTMENVPLNGRCYEFIPGAASAYMYQITGGHLYLYEQDGTPLQVNGNVFAVDPAVRYYVELGTDGPAETGPVTVKFEPAKTISEVQVSVNRELWAYVDEIRPDDILITYQDENGNTCSLRGGETDGNGYSADRFMLKDPDGDETWEIYGPGSYEYSFGFYGNRYSVPVTVKDLADVSGMETLSLGTLREIPANTTEVVKLVLEKPAKVQPELSSECGAYLYDSSDVSSYRYQMNGADKLSLDAGTYYLRIVNSSAEASAIQLNQIVLSQLPTGALDEVPQGERKYYEFQTEPLPESGTYDAYQFNITGATGEICDENGVYLGYFDSNGAYSFILEPSRIYEVGIYKHEDAASLSISRVPAVKNIRASMRTQAFPERIGSLERHDVVVSYQDADGNEHSVTGYQRDENGYIIASADSDPEGNVYQAGETYTANVIFAGKNVETTFTPVAISDMEFETLQVNQERVLEIDEKAYLRFTSESTGRYQFRMVGGRLQIYDGDTLEPLFEEEQTYNQVVNLEAGKNYYIRIVNNYYSSEGSLLVSQEAAIKALEVLQSTDSVPAGVPFMPLAGVQLKATYADETTEILYEDHGEMSSSAGSRVEAVVKDASGNPASYEGGLPEGEYTVELSFGGTTASYPLRAEAQTEENLPEIQQGTNTLSASRVNYFKINMEETEYYVNFSLPACEYIYRASDASCIIGARCGADTWRLDQGETYYAAIWLDGQTGEGQETFTLDMTKEEGVASLEVVNKTTALQFGKTGMLDDLQLKVVYVSGEERLWSPMTEGWQDNYGNSLGFYVTNKETGERVDVNQVLPAGTYTVSVTLGSVRAEDYEVVISPREYTELGYGQNSVSIPAGETKLFLLPKDERDRAIVEFDCSLPHEITYEKTGDDSGLNWLGMGSYISLEGLQQVGNAYLTLTNDTGEAVTIDLGVRSCQKERVSFTGEGIPEEIAKGWFTTEDLLSGMIVEFTGEDGTVTRRVLNEDVDENGYTYRFYWKSGEDMITDDLIALGEGTYYPCVEQCWNEYPEETVVSSYPVRVVPDEATPQEVDPETGLAACVDAQAGSWYLYSFTAAAADNYNVVFSQDVRFRWMVPGESVQGAGYASGTSFYVPLEAGQTCYFRISPDAPGDVKFSMFGKLPKDITALDFKDIEDQKYRPGNITPEPVITDNSDYTPYVLVENTDYSVEYMSNSMVGQGMVIIRGMGDYCGEVTQYFNILPLTRSDISIDGLQSFYYETGYEIKPALDMRVGEESLTEGVDYTVSYSNCLDPGYAVAQVRGVNGNIEPFDVSYEIGAKQLLTHDLKADTVYPGYNAVCTAPESGIQWYFFYADEYDYLIQEIPKNAQPENGYDPVKVYRTLPGKTVLEDISAEAVGINEQKGISAYRGPGGDSGCIYIRMTADAGTVYIRQENILSIDDAGSASDETEALAGVMAWRLYSGKKGTYRFHAQEAGKLSLYQRTDTGLTPLAQLELKVSETSGTEAETFYDLEGGEQYYVVLDGSENVSKWTFGVELKETALVSLVDGINEVYVPYGETMTMKLPEGTGRRYFYSPDIEVKYSVGTLEDPDRIASGTGQIVPYMAAEDVQEPLYLTIDSPNSGSEMLSLEVGAVPTAEAVIRSDSVPDRVEEGWEDLAAKYVCVDVAYSEENRVCEHTDGEMNKYGYMWRAECTEGVPGSYTVVMQWNQDAPQTVGTFSIEGVPIEQLRVLERNYTHGLLDLENAHAVMYQFIPAVSGIYELELMKNGLPGSAWIYTSPDEAPEQVHREEFTVEKGVPCRLLIALEETWGDNELWCLLRRKGSVPTLQVELVGEGSYTFTGSPIIPEVKVTDADCDYIPQEGIDYTVTYEGNYLAGNGTVNICGDGEYNVAVNRGLSLDFTIEKAPFSQVVFPRAQYTYNGKAISYKETGVLGDWEVSPQSYQIEAGDTDLVNAGTGRLLTLVSTDRNFEGSTQVPFDINPISFDRVSARVTSNCVYTGDAVEPGLALENLDTGADLVKGQDYTVACSDNTDAGTGHYRIQGIGNYTSVLEGNFTILPRDLCDEDVQAEPVLPQNYTGKPLTPVPVMTFHGRELVPGTDYTLKYRNNTEMTDDVNKAFMILSGIGNYTGERTLSFEICNEEIAGETVAPEALQTDHTYESAQEETWYSWSAQQEDMMYLRLQGDAAAVRFYHFREDKNVWARVWISPMTTSADITEWMLPLDAGTKLGLCVPAGAAFEARSSRPAALGSLISGNPDAVGLTLYRLEAEKAGTYEIFAQKPGVIFAGNEEMHSYSSAGNKNYLADAEESLGIAAKYPEAFRLNLDAGCFFLAVPATDTTYEAFYLPKITGISIVESEQTKSAFRRLDSEFFGGISVKVTCEDQSEETVPAGSRDSYGRKLECVLSTEDGQNVYPNGQSLEPGTYKRMIACTDVGMKEPDFGIVESSSSFRVESMEASYSDNRLAAGETLTLRTETPGSPEIYVLDASRSWKYILSGTSELQIRFCDENGESGKALSGTEHELELEAGRYYLHIVPQGDAETSVSVAEKEAPGKIRYVDAYGDVNSIGITWATASKLGTTYELYRCAQGETEFSLLAALDNRSTTYYRDSDVEDGKTYEYYVVAKDGRYMTSERSEIVRCEPGKDQEAPVVKALKPEKGSRLNESVEFEASATDNVAVASMKLMIRNDDSEEAAAFAEAEGDRIRFVLDTKSYQDGVYYIRAIALDAAGNESSALEQKYLFDNTAPERVTGITTESTSVTATIHWQDVDAEDLAFFRVERKDADGTWTLVGDTSSTLGMNFTDLTPDTEYRYRVAAYDLVGNRGEATDEIYVRTKADTLAPVISALSPKEGRYHGMLSFRATGSDEYGVKGLKIQYSADLSQWTDAAQETYEQPEKSRNLQAEIDVSAMEEGSLYLRGVAEDFAGNISDCSESAPYVEFIVDHTAPGAPAGVKAESGDGYIHVSWEQGTEEDLGLYEIYRSTDGQNYTLLKGSLDALGYVDRDVVSNGTYYYKVKAADRAGNVSAFSEAAQGVATDDTTAPVIQSVSPKNQSAFAALGVKEITLSAAVTDNRSLSSISFYQKRAADAEYELAGSVTEIGEACKLGTIALPVSDVEDGQTIYLKVEAYDAAGNAAVPVEFTCTADKTAPAVQNPKAEYHENERKVTLTWSSGQEADLAGYYVYRKAEGGDWSLLVTRKADPSKTEYAFRDESLPDTGGTFLYKVAAMDQLGNRASAETGQVTVAEITEEKLPEPPAADLQCENLMEIGVEYLFDAGNSTAGSEIVKYQFDFGDGEMVSGKKSSAIHKYAKEGHYTVRVTVWDADGLEGSFLREVTVRERSTLGNVEVTVCDYEGNTVANAPVYFDLGASNQFIRNTDSFGKVTITAGVGMHTIGCYKDGYLPVKKDVLLLSGETVQAKLEIKEEPLVTGEFEVHRMTLEEIIAAGIDVTAPENQYVAEVTVHMTYKEAPLDYSFKVNWDGLIIDPLPIELEDTELHPFIIPWPSPDPDDGDGGGGGSIGPDPWPDPTKYTLVFLEIPVGVSMLKEFFDVKLHIMNHASSEFSLLDNDVTLQVPKGLTIVNTNISLPNEHAHIDQIAGGNTETLHWILRGDEVGTYDLTADFAGTLSTFNTRVNAQFQTKDPIQVYGLSNAKLRITIPETIGIYGDEHKGMLEYSLNLKNEGSIDMYLPRLSVRDEDKVYSTLYVSSAGAQLLENGEFPDVLRPGEYIEMQCSMDAEGYELYELVNWYTEIYNGYGLQVEVEVLSDEYTDNSIAFTQEGGVVLRNRDITINGTTYTTDAEGCIYPNPEDLQDTLEISAYGYFDYSVEKEKILGPNGTHQVVLQIKVADGKPYVSSLHYRQVKMEGDTAEGPWKNGLTDSLTLFMESEEYYTYVMTAGWNGNEPGTYVLQQTYGGKLESEDGIFSEKQLNKLFDPDRPIYAYVRSKNGKASKPVKTQLSIRPEEDDPYRLFGGKLEMGSSIDFTVPDEFPILGGNKLSMDLDDIPLSVSAEGYDVKIGVNFGADNKDDWSLVKKYLSKTDNNKDSTENAMLVKQLGKKLGAASKIKKFLGDDGKLGYNIIGYVQLTYTEGGHYEVTEGKIAVTIELSGEMYQQVAVKPPIFFVVGFGTKFGGSGSVSRPLVDSTLPFIFNLELMLTPFFKLTGGLGFKDVIAVEVTGGAEADITWNVTSDYQQVIGRANGEIKAYVGPFTFLDKELKSDDVLLFYHNGAEDKEKAQAAGNGVTYADTLKKVYDASNYSAAEAAYAYSEDWNGGRLSSGTEADPDLAEDEQLLQDNVYPDARQTVLEAGDTKMMLWLSQDKERSGQNSTILVYSLYDKQKKTWSTPKPVLDDGTADLYPEAAVKDGRIYVIWQNTSKVLEENETTLEDMAKHVEICTAYYQEKTDSFVPEDTKSNSDELYGDPAIVSDGNTMYAVWNGNTAKDIFGIQGTNSILASKMTEDGWSSPQTLASGLPILVSNDMTVIDGGLRVASIQDTDGDYTTDSDWELYEYCWNADDTFGQKRITTNTVKDSDPAYSQEKGRGVLYWTSEGMTARMYLDTPDTQETLSLQTGSGRKQIVTERGTYLLWIGDSGKVREANEIYCAAYDEETGTYGNPVCITDRGRFITSFQASDNKDGSIELIYQARPITVQGETAAYGNSRFYQQTIQPEADLALTDNGNIRSERVYPGASVNFQAVIENQGIFPAAGYMVQILNEDGKAVATRNYSETLAPGAARELTIPYLLPLEFTGQTYRVRATLGAGYESNTENNTFEVPISGKELDIRSVKAVRSGKKAVCTIKAQNRGSVSLDALTLEVREDTPEGTLLDTVTLKKAAPGEIVTWTYELDLTKLTTWQNGNARIYFIAAEEGVSERGATAIHVDPDSVLKLSVVDSGTTETGVHASVFVQNDGLEDKTETIAAVLHAEDGSMLSYQTAEVTAEAGTTVRQEVDIPAESLSGNWTVQAVPMVPVTEIVLNKEKVTLILEETLALTAQILPENAVDQNVRFVSSDEAVASVAADGTVTAHKVGTAEIRCEAADGYGAFAACTVTVREKHIWGEWTTDQEPTCTEAGTEIRHCLDEGCTETEQRGGAPALGHTGGTATCQSPAICERCQEPYGELGGHDYGEEYTIDKEPTCTETGSKSRHCQTEGCTEKTDVAALEMVSHTGGTATCQSPAICEVCHSPYGELGEHNYSEEYTTDKEPTCTETGSKSRRCQTEGCTEKTDVTTLEMLPHTGGTATCQSPAICEVCHSPYGELGEHDYSEEYTTDKEPTCTETGSKSRHCQTEGCTEKTDVTTLEMVPHTGGTATCQSPAICEMCQEPYGESAPHTGGKATCRSQAVCEVCNEPYGELAPHKGGTATCQSQAVCEVCDEPYGELAPHTGGTATCQSPAVCEVCDEPYGELGEHTGGTATCQSPAICEVCSEPYGEPGDHEFDTAWTVDVRPTCLKTGSRSHHCKTAGCTEKQGSESIAKLKGTIKLTVKSLPIQLKKSASLKSIVTGLSEGDYIKSWKSGSSKIVTVNTSGKITGKKVGKATITVTLASGAKASVKITVQKPAVRTKNITNLSKKLTLKPGKKVSLKPMLEPLTSLEKIRYSSSNKKVAAVTAKGVLTAKASGKAKITVKSGKKKFVVTVKVAKIAPTKINGIPAAKTLKKGKTLTLKPKLSPKGASAKLKYTSSNKAVAEVNAKGKITAKKKGTAVITVTAGKLKVACKIKVS